MREREYKTIQLLANLDDKICSEQASREDLELYSQLKCEQETFEEIRAKGAWIRSKINFIEMNEKRRAFFFNQEKETYERKRVKKLTKEM